MPDPVVVIGAGISGAACAGALVANDIDVVVVDRGRRVGGRLATRTTSTGHIVDIGASYFTVQNNGFRRVVDGWLSDGVAREWTDTFHVADAESVIGTKIGPVRYAADRGFRSLVEGLCDRLPADAVRNNTTVESVVVDSAGRLRVDDIAAAGVALCMPGPQAIRLLTDDEPRFGTARQIADEVSWEPVIAVTLQFEQRTWRDIDGVFVNDDPVITWIADDGKRRGDDAPVLVAHVDPVYSGLHLEDPAAVIPATVGTVMRLLGLETFPEHVDAHRWTYAKPLASFVDEYFLDEDIPLGMAGDAWFDGPRMEAAWCSGDALGHALAARLLR